MEKEEGLGDRSQKMKNDPVSSDGKLMEDSRGQFGKSKEAGG